MILQIFMSFNLNVVVLSFLQRNKQPKTNISKTMQSNINFRHNASTCILHVTNGIFLWLILCRKSGENIHTAISRKCKSEEGDKTFPLKAYLLQVYNAYKSIC